MWYIEDFRLIVYFFSNYFFFVVDNFAPLDILPLFLYF